MKSALTKTDQRDIHGYCCYLQMEIADYFCRLLLRKMLFRLGDGEGYTDLKWGWQKASTTRYYCGQLSSSWERLPKSAKTKQNG